MDGLSDFSEGSYSVESDAFDDSDADSVRRRLNISDVTMILDHISGGRMGTMTHKQTKSTSARYKPSIQLSIRKVFQTIRGKLCLEK